MYKTTGGNNPGRTRVLVEGALCVALSVVFSYLKIFSMPQGGSVTIEMAPLLYFAYRHGLKWGLIAGALSGSIQLIFGGYVVHPAQAFLDYPAAFACMGIAGLFGQGMGEMVAGTVIASAARLACHVLSGVIFFASYAPEGTNVWLYSFIYNATFMLPSVLLSAALALILRKKFLKSERI